MDRIGFEGDAFGVAFPAKRRSERSASMDLLVTHLVLNDAVRTSAHTAGLERKREEVILRRTTVEGIGISRADRVLEGGQVFAAVGQVEKARSFVYSGKVVRLARGSKNDIGYLLLQYIAFMLNHCINSQKGDVSVRYFRLDFVGDVVAEVLGGHFIEELILEIGNHTSIIDDQ